MLLEVLIAFALIVLCALPLIYPHVFILRSEKKFVSSVELDHYVNLLFVDTLEKLYLNEISWAVIEGGKPQIIEDIGNHLMSDGNPLPFDGTYQFVEERKKVSKEGEHSAHIFKLTYSFVPKKGVFLEKAPEKYTYVYRIVIERGAKS